MKLQKAWRIVFPGVACEILKTELRNKDRPPKSHRYCDEVKIFAITLNFYSPRAYNYVRSFLFLPCPSAIANWTSSVNCKPGFFKDTFKDLQEKAHSDTLYQDCAMIFNGIYIKTGTIYNNSNGNCEGFVDYGEGISAFDPDKIASEALVFMLVGLQGH